jgi:3-oxoacyl-[acyl-carrier protein] reductase
MADFGGKVALITGGGTGIGRATALQLAAEGAALAVNYSRSQQEAEDTGAELRAGGARALVVKADVADDAQVRAMVAAAVAEFGGLDILVNSAGITRAVAPTNLDGILEQDFEEIFRVNFMGVLFCCRAAIPEMKRRGGGHIVNVGSIAGLNGLGSSLLYSASKAAVMNLTRGMAHSQAPAVQVNCVVPGLVETRWTATVSEEFARSNREATPMGRAARAEDVATAIVGLLQSKFITGANLVVDGGRTI